MCSSYRGMYTLIIISSNISFLNAKNIIYCKIGTFKLWLHCHLLFTDFDTPSNKNWRRNQQILWQQIVNNIVVVYMINLWYRTNNILRHLLDKKWSYIFYYFMRLNIFGLLKEKKFAFLFGAKASFCGPF